MKIVIDIPEKTFTYYVTLANKGEQIGNLERIILDGTPLPEHFGRLISEEDMLSVIMFSKLFDDAKAGEVKEALRNIPTIIEGSEE